MDSEHPVIRPADKADAESIAALYAEMDRVHRERHPELFQSANTVIRSTSSVEALLGAPHTAVLVAEITDGGLSRVCGFVRVIDTATPEGRPLAPRRFALVDDLVVAVDVRRQGVASSLLAAAEEWARARGLSALEATVWAFNQPMLELCEKQGAAIVRHYVRKTLDS